MSIWDTDKDKVVDCTTPMTEEEVAKFFEYATEAERAKRKERMTKEEKKAELEKQILKIYKDLPPFVEIDSENHIARSRTKAEMNTLRLAEVVHQMLKIL